MPNSPILECIPNFSEGRNELVIQKIVSSIEKISNVKVLHVDMGHAANRTVVTFAGEANAVVSAAFEAVKTAAQCIDMSKHAGVHPRIGATDVLPLVPISGISMAETVVLSHKLAEKIGVELEIPVYCYENSAFIPERKKLENIRKGEYEGLPVKLNDPYWKPDFGPLKMNVNSGATVLGARNFLIAYNVTLDSQSVELAKLIAAEIRESGKIITDASGNKIHKPGLLPAVKAIGWFIDEYRKVQVSMNITDMSKTSVHEAFEMVKKVALFHNVAVCGSELIGLIPLQALLDAGNFYVKRKSDSKILSKNELIGIAIAEMGLDHIKPFNQHKRIIEYLLS
jgi:glutamate formiminotransferase/formiminotetrahydrofolate cyclodeaminase